MKFSMAVFKKGKPIYWIIGAIVLFVFFYWMINKGSSSASSGSGGVTTVNAGPSDAAIAASTQIGMANISANAANNQTAAAVAIATLQMQGQTAQTYAAMDLARYTAGLDAATAARVLDTQLEIAGMEKEYSYSTAVLAADVTRDQFLSNERIVLSQLETNADMFATMSQAAVYSSLIGQVGNVKANDRDNMLAMLAASMSGQGLTFIDPGHSNIYLAPRA